MKPTLVIMAAGMASRYGSMKQTEGFGPSNETIMEYSIYDAIEAGFCKVIFIIRKEFANAFAALIEPKIKGKIEIDYAFQEINAYLNDGELPADRTKPWGTGHALLCALENVTTPFAVINADDFYGKDAFEKASIFLQNNITDNNWGMLAYPLKNTLSDNGSVSRGVCVIENDCLKSIVERTNILYKNNKLIFIENDEEVELSEETKVSMNFWLFNTNAFNNIQKLFRQFIETKGNIPKSEFYIQNIVNDFLEDNNNQLKTMATESKWFGVTYKEDANTVKESVQNLVSLGIYPNNLWAK